MKSLSKIRTNPKANELKAGDVVVSDKLRGKNGKLLEFVFAPCNDNRTKCSPHLNGTLADWLCFKKGEIS